jgi:ParB family transcriptional regulator, chromosome partitioning protein
MPIQKLRRNPSNPRGHVSLADVEDLVASVKRHGILEPLVVQPDGQIITGERRYVAAKYAGLKFIPVVVREVANEKESSELSLIENIQRENLKPVTEAKAYERMIAEGSTIAGVCKKTGMKVDRIYRLLKLLQLPGFVQEAVESEKMSLMGAISLLQIKDENLRHQAATRAIEGSWGIKEIKAIVNDTTISKPSRQTRNPEITTGAYQVGRCSVCSERERKLTASRAFITRLEDFISQNLGAQFVPTRPEILR